MLKYNSIRFFSDACPVWSARWIPSWHRTTPLFMGWFGLKSHITV